jgi:hypothetical protein
MKRDAVGMIALFKGVDERVAKKQTTEQITTDFYYLMEVCFQRLVRTLATKVGVTNYFRE